MGSRMGKISSSRLLPTHQFGPVSNIHFPTFRQKCKLLPPYTVSAFHPFHSFLFHNEGLFNYRKSCLLTTKVITGTTSFLNHCVAMSTKSISIETINVLLSSCCVEAPNPTTLSHSLKVRHDHIFESSRSVHTELESLQICFKIVNSVEIYSHWLKHWVGLKLASIFSANRFANNCGLAGVSLVNNNFTCEH